MSRKSQRRGASWWKNVVRKQPAAARSLEKQSFVAEHLEPRRLLGDTVTTAANSVVGNLSPLIPEQRDAATAADQAITPAIAAALTSGLPAFATLADAIVAAKRGFDLLAELPIVDESIAQILSASTTSTVSGLF